ncbi:MAG: DNA polymerase III subunit delta [Chitinophagia bacterium]|nr:DNA polymerase III subunit delta [Chitinophagia bacterium]
MTTEYKQLIKKLDKKEYAPVYLIEGEEPFYLDRLTHYFEEKILQPEERDFNLITLYGKDATFQDIVSACRRYPMFADRQLVILKEAASFKDINELIGYIEKPMPSTIFLIQYKHKKLPDKSKLLDAVKRKGEHFLSKPLKEKDMPSWITQYGREHGLTIGQKEAETLSSHLGVDLQKIANEIDKVRINLKNETVLTAQHISTFIGISKEYNLYELPELITNANQHERLFAMLHYMLSVPESAPMPVITTMLYSHYSRIYMARYLPNNIDDSKKKDMLGSWKLALYEDLAKKMHPAIPDRALRIIAEYNTKSVGINSHDTPAAMLKELVMKLVQLNNGWI